MQAQRSVAAAAWGRVVRRMASTPGAALLLALCLPLAAQADTQVRTSGFDHDARGLLIREVIEPDQPDDCLQTTHRYDAWGNKAGVAAGACAGASGHTVASATAARAAATDWGPDGRFPVASTNALGHRDTQTFDPRFGLPVRLVGPNGLATTWTYDGLGRRIREQRADGTATSWRYLLCTDPGAECPPGLSAPVAWVVIEQSWAADARARAPGKRQYHDKLARVLRVQTTGFDGAGPAAVLVQDTEYDRLGRIARKSALYAVAGGSPAWTTFAYDVLGRPVTQTSPDPDAPGGQASVTTAYNGLSTTVTNPKGQRKTSTNNAQGLLAQVTDEQGNTVAYRYDALGQLIETDAAGLVTRLRYDQRGRKVAMQDPAMGEWRYAHNAHGELVWQRDALGQTATQAFDALGRLVQRSEPDLVSRWSYDRRFDQTACGKSIGKLCEATTDNGYRRLHRYDALGRPLSTSTVLDNPQQPAVVSVAYDAATGRVARQRWPTGLEARYEYTEGGFLRRVTGSQPPTAGATTPPAAPVSYEVLAMDSQDRITRFRQGNLVTVRTFDAATGRLRNQQAGAVLNHSYGYDSLGNLTSRTDTSPGVGTRESFAYDRLNRLGLYTVNGGGLTKPQATQVLYDPRGNIRYKSDVGSYWYDPARPTRLAHITLDTAPAASLALTGTRALSYAFDDNGNLLYTVGQDLPRARHTHRRESYTSFNKPSEFSYSEFALEGAPASGASADRTLNFVYGPEHQRIRQQVRIAGNAPSALSSGSTWYLHGEGEQALSYEKEVKDAGLVEHRHYLQAGGMVFAMFVTRTGTLAGHTPTAPRYFHHDHLGSIAAITDEGGQLVERLAYDPWGKRRQVDGASDPTDSLIGWTTERGYTMHEHLDEIGVIHMNGRVYDPLIGRFMSADPFIQSPQDLQSHNRYAYVLNNPLAYTDPSGYFSWRRLLKTVAAIAVAVNFGPAVIGNFAGAGQLFTAASFGGSAAAAGVANAAVAGFMSGAVSSGSVKGALHGALTGALFFGVGEFVPGAVGSMSKVLGHAAAGCISAAAGGGRCSDGAVAAGVAQLGGPAGGDLGDLGDMAADAVKTAVLGAMGGMLRGGRFDEGLMTGALDYLFNALAHRSQRDRRFYSAAAGVVETVGWENPENDRQGHGFRIKVRTVSDASLFLYAHVEPDSIMVYEGLVVLRGEYLGRYAQPANGSATGPHLHFEWWSKARERLDPAAFLSVVMPSAIVRDTIRFRSFHPVSGRARWHNGYDLVGPSPQ